MKSREYAKRWLAGLLCAVTLCLASCSSAPSLESVKDRAVALIEASYEINEIFWGEGLPVYEMPSSGSYGEDGEYEPVSLESAYASVQDIKNAAEKVYSASYLEGIYEQIFDGYALEGGYVNAPRFAEKSDGLYQLIEKDVFITSRRIYEYDTMKIVKPSRATYVNIEILTYTEENPDEKVTVTLSLTKQNGEWFLDSPTY